MASSKGWWDDPTRKLHLQPPPSLPAHHPLDTRAAQAHNRGGGRR